MHLWIIMRKERTEMILLISKIKISMRFSLLAKRRSSNTTKECILSKNQHSMLLNMKEATTCRMSMIPNSGIRSFPTIKLCLFQYLRKNSRRKRKRSARVRLNKLNSSKTSKLSSMILWMPNSTTKLQLLRKNKLNPMKRLSEKCLKSLSSLLA
jgi:hypothetical protein